MVRRRWGGLNLILEEYEILLDWNRMWTNQLETLKQILTESRFSILGISAEKMNISEKDLT